MLSSKTSAGRSPAMASRMRRKQRRKGDRLIEFLAGRVVIFFVEVGLLNCINCNPVPRRDQEPSSPSALKKRPSADSGLQLDLEIALNGVSARIQPLRLIQPCRR